MLTVVEDIHSPVVHGLLAAGSLDIIGVNIICQLFLYKRYLLLIAKVEKKIGGANDWDSKIVEKKAVPPNFDLLLLIVELILGLVVQFISIAVIVINDQLVHLLFARAYEQHGDGQVCEYDSPEVDGHKRYFYENEEVYGGQSKKCDRHQESDKLHHLEPALLGASGACDSVIVVWVVAHNKDLEFISDFL